MSRPVDAHCQLGLLLPPDLYTYHVRRFRAEATQELDRKPTNARPSIALHQDIAKCGLAKNLQHASLHALAPHDQADQIRVRGLKPRALDLPSD